MQWPCGRTKQAHSKKESLRVLLTQLLKSLPSLAAEVFVVNSFCPYSTLLAFCSNLKESNMHTTVVSFSSLKSCS